MGRTFAGVLGCIGFLVVIGRGLANQGGGETTIRLAIVHLIALAIVGGVIGRIAAWTIEQSVYGQAALLTDGQKNNVANNNGGDSDEHPR